MRDDGVWGGGAGHWGTVLFDSLRRNVCVVKVVCMRMA